MTGDPPSVSTPAASTSLSPASSTTDRLRRAGQLLALYVAQGLPFGLATTFVPLLLAQRPDFSYLKGTVVSLAAFPWFLKVLWAPLVDTRYVSRFGRRRSWILPAQGLLALCTLLASFVDWTGPVALLFGTVAVLNLCASVQDTAVDALAVELLPPEERGLANVAQVGGYKAGMVIGGSGLVALAAVSSQRFALQAMAALVMVLWLVPWFLVEPKSSRPITLDIAARPSTTARRVLQSMTSRDWLATLLFVGTIKLGEAMMGGILKPFLVRELGLTPTRVAFVAGGLGITASLLGSVTGGILATRFDRRRLLFALGLAQSIGCLLLAISTRQHVAENVLIGAILVQHFAVGLLTPVLFAYLMDLCDPAAGATYYTVLATIELASRTAGTTLAGPLADVLGPVSLLTLAAVLTVPPLMLVGRLRAEVAARPD